jgi:hypothetical protein
MIWEWEQGNTGGQWTLTFGGWHAVVRRLPGARPRWLAALDQTTAPHDRHEGPTYTDAMDARSWCLRTIAELANTAL